MTNHETPAEVLADIARRIVDNAMPATDSGATCFVPRYQIDQLSHALEAERSLAAGKVATLPEGYRIEVQHGDGQWMTTAYTLVTPDKRRWSPAPMEPGYYLLAALSAPPADPAKASEHERDMLANAIRDAAVKAGIVREDVGLTGPDLLMLCDDLATNAKASGSAPDVESAAMQIYEAMRFGREGSTPAWVAAGNSLTQDIARRTARALLATPPASAPEVTEGYYLATFKQRAHGGEILWWGPDNCGYTPDLKRAGIYTKITPGYHDSDVTVPVPVSFIRGRRVRSIVDPGDSDNTMFWTADKLRAALTAALPEPRHDQ